MGKAVKALKDKKALKKRMEKETMSSFTVESKDKEIYKIAGSILEEVPDRIDQHMMKNR